MHNFEIAVKKLALKRRQLLPVPFCLFRDKKAKSFFKTLQFGSAGLF